MEKKSKATGGFAVAQCYAAVWTVHTPGGPTDACEAHADKLQQLMQFMGAYTNKTPAPEGAQCENCINEAKQPNVKLCDASEAFAAAQCSAVRPFVAPKEK